MKRILALFLYALIPFAYSNDCIPLAFQNLSERLNRAVSYDTWVDELATEKEPPLLGRAIESWNSHFPDRNLVCIFSVDPSIDVSENPIIFYPFGEPYLWIGKIPDRLKDPKSKANSHAALLSITQDQKFILVHPLNPESTEFFIEKLSEKEFFKRTYVVYQLEKDE